MKSFLLNLFGLGSAADKVNAAPQASLNYDNVILLDAEDLAEQGILAAYEKLRPELGKYVGSPAPIEEVIDADAESYGVRCNGTVHVIYSPALQGSESESWPRATYAFFTIVNDQLKDADVHLYALNGGNDLCGMFLSPEQAQSAQAGLPRKSDWPYLPEISGPHYGQFH